MKNKLICFPDVNMRREFVLRTDWESFDMIRYKGVLPDGSNCALVIVDSMECVNHLYDEIFNYDELELDRINEDLAHQIRMYKDNDNSRITEISPNFDPKKE